MPCPPNTGGLGLEKSYRACEPRSRPNRPKTHTFRSSIFRPTVGLTCAQLSRCRPWGRFSTGHHPGLTGASGTACTRPADSTRRDCRRVPAGARDGPQQPESCARLPGSPRARGGQRVAVADLAPGSHLSGTADTETGHGLRKALAHTPPSTGKSGRVRGHTGV